MAHGAARGQRHSAWGGSTVSARRNDGPSLHRDALTRIGVVCPPQCGITLCATRYRDTALSARRADERPVPGSTDEKVGTQPPVPHWGRLSHPQCGITLCSTRYRDTALSARRADERPVPGSTGREGGGNRGEVSNPTPSPQLNSLPQETTRSGDAGMEHRRRIGSFVPNAVSHCAQPGIAIPRCRGVTRLPLFVRFSPSPQSADPRAFAPARPRPEGASGGQLA